MKKNSSKMIVFGAKIDTVIDNRLYFKKLKLFKKKSKVIKLKQSILIQKTARGFLGRRKVIKLKHMQIFLPVLNEVLKHKVRQPIH